MRRIRLVDLLVLGTYLAPAVAAGAPFAYVANAFDGTVSVLDVRTAAIVATVPVGCDPRDLAALPDGSRVYVANTCADDPDMLTDTVSVIDAATRAVVDTIDVGTAPLSLAVRPDGSRLYVANIGQKTFLDVPVPGSISVIDTAANTVVATLPLAFPPRDVAVAPDGSVLYVSGPDGLTLLDPTSGDVLGSIAAPNGWQGVDPGGAMLYVAGSDDALSLIDLATGAVVASLPMGVAPQDIAVGAGGRRVYVTSSGANPNQPPDEVTVAAPRRARVVSRLDGGWTPTGLALASRRLLVVANFYSGDVLIMRATNGRVVRTGHAGSGADAVVVVRR
jgi:YVTN family beta-propeller protein